MVVVALTCVVHAVTVDVQVFPVGDAVVVVIVVGIKRVGVEPMDFVTVGHEVAVAVSGCRVGAQRILVFIEQGVAVRVQITQVRNTVVVGVKVTLVEAVADADVVNPEVVAVVVGGPAVGVGAPCEGVCACSDGFSVLPVNAAAPSLGVARILPGTLVEINAEHQPIVVVFAVDVIVERDIGFFLKLYGHGHRVVIAMTQATERQASLEIVAFFVDRMPAIESEIVDVVTEVHPLAVGTVLVELVRHGHFRGAVKVQVPAVLVAVEDAVAVHVVVVGVGDAVFVEVRNARSDGHDVVDVIALAAVVG